MPHDPESFADMVVLTVKAALTPILERVAGLEARVAQALAVEPAVSALRDRVVVVETKAAAPLAAPEPHDTLSPVLERLAAGEARLARLAAVELSLTELRDKFVALEAKAAHEPVAAGPSEAEVELSVLEALEPLTVALHAAQERIAVLETRAPVPGPAGPAGKDGAPGLDGKDGAAGLHGKDGLAGLSFEGVYQEGKGYDFGHLVTYAGSSWHCNEPTTTKPGDGSKAWTLMVKRGRDGKDGRDAEGGLPVVKVRP